MAIGENNLVTLCGCQYETVAASQTEQVLGGTGAVGDRLDRLIVAVNTAGTTSVSITDGSGSAIPVLANPAGSESVVIELGIYSVSGAWKVTTGAGCTVLAIGRFTA